jgi:hypothetical protein
MTSEEGSHFHSSAYERIPNADNAPNNDNRTMTAVAIPNDQFSQRFSG